MKILFSCITITLLTQCSQHDSTFPFSNISSPSSPKHPRLTKLPQQKQLSNESLHTLAKEHLQKASPKKGKLISAEKPVTLPETGFIVYNGSHNYLGHSLSMVVFNQSNKYNQQKGITPNILKLRSRSHFNISTETFPKDTYKITYLFSNLTPLQNIHLHIAKHIVNYRYDFGTAIVRDSIYITPPTFFEPFTIYDKYNKLVYQSPQEYPSLPEPHIKVAQDYIQQTFKLQKKHLNEISFDPYLEPQKRHQFCDTASKLLNSDKIPKKFKTAILKTAGEFLLTEMNESILQLSRKTAKQAPYVREMHRLFHISKDKDYDHPLKEKWHKLYKRLDTDCEQNLRAEIDETLEIFAAKANIAKIVQRLKNNKTIEPHLYHLFHTNRQALAKTLLKEIKYRKPLYYNVQLPISRLKKISPKTLLYFLEHCKLRTFILLSPYCVDIIKKHRPEWKNKLQSALIAFYHISEASGYNKTQGLDALVNKYDPDFFDKKAISNHLKNVTLKSSELVGKFMSIEEVKEYLKRLETTLEQK